MSETSLTREERLAFALVDADAVIKNHELAIKERDGVILTQQTELAALIPLIETHDALMARDKTMSITGASKHFELKPRKWVLPYMWSHDLLTLDNRPTANAFALGLLVLKEAYNGTTGYVADQAMVEVRQLKRWLEYLVPRILQWVQENGL